MPKKLDDLHSAIFKSLKKQFPKMHDKDLDQRAWAIAQKRYKDLIDTQSHNPEEITMSNNITSNTFTD